MTRLMTMAAAFLSRLLAQARPSAKTLLAPMASAGILAGALGGALPMMPALAVASAASFYVSVSGDDGNDGSAAAPFRTLERARDAMRGSSVKTASVGPGIYARKAPLVLTKLDDAETWLGNRVAELDGGGTIADGFLIMGGSHITIDGFKIKNVLYRGVGIHGGAAFSDDPVFNVTTGPAAGNTVQNTEVFNISAPRGAKEDYSFWNSGGVLAEGNVPQTTIAHNYFHDIASMGTRLGAERPGDDISGSAFDSNIVVNAMQSISDGGAIYVQDTILKSVNISITHNYIYNFQGPSNDQGRGIYLDQSASNVAITNNIIRAGEWGAEGASAVLLSGGSNNVVSNNIIDLGCNSRTITAVFLMLPSGPNTEMRGNRFERNLILSNFKGAQNTFFFNQDGYSYYCGGNVPAPRVANNVYFNAAGGEEGTDGNCLSDAAPRHVNPQVSPVQYKFAQGNALLKAPVNFHPIPSGWGTTGALPDSIPGTCQATATGSRSWSPRLLRHWVRRLKRWL
jgi:Right handed beta helix region